MITPVILSGGSGTRLWPLSRSARPKQFLDMTGSGVMLDQTVARCADRDVYAAPVIVASARHESLLASDTAREAARIILEPAARNTAPAIALAAMELAPDALMLVMPSDHVVGDMAAFHAAVERAAPLAQDGWLMTFGIMPTGPETGYGYIKWGEEIGSGVTRVERFVEKPKLADARDMVTAGGYSWNAGIFLFSAQAYLEALGAHAPEMLAAVRAAHDAASLRGNVLIPNAEALADCPSDSVDYAVMEKAARVAVVPVDMGWSDIGSWDALNDLLVASGAADAQGNVTLGDVVLNDCSGAMVRSDGPLVAVAGMADVIVVATGDAVLVMPRGESQRVKQVVAALQEQSHPML